MRYASSTVKIRPGLAPTPLLFGHFIRVGFKTEERYTYSLYDRPLSQRRLFFLRHRPWRVSVQCPQLLLAADQDNMAAQRSRCEVSKLSHISPSLGSGHSLCHSFVCRVSQCCSHHDRSPLRYRTFPRCHSPSCNSRIPRGNSARGRQQRKMI